MPCLCLLLMLLSACPAMASNQSFVPQKAFLLTQLKTESQSSSLSRGLIAGENGRVSVALVNKHGKCLTFANRIIDGKNAAPPVLVSTPGTRLTSQVSIHWFLVKPGVSGRTPFQDVPLKTVTDRWEISLDELRHLANPSLPIGTFRFRVEVIYRPVSGREHRLWSPGGSKALRLSFRKDDTYLGWLTSYFHVPYRYGSIQREVRDYLFSDCVDFVVAGYQRMGRVKLGDMGSKTMLGQKWKWFFDTICLNPINKEGVFSDRDRNRFVSFGAGGVRPGDIILFRGHAAVLLKDINGNGLLDSGDHVLHHLGAPPRVEAISTAWHGPFKIIRWKDFSLWQSRLARIGLYKGPANGIFNAELETAVIQFQRSIGLKPDGIPGPTTGKKLNTCLKMLDRKSRTCLENKIHPKNGV